jgi:probable phosphoglycerate mutase
MNLYFVRHGETDYNRQGRIQGGLDIKLNENGQVQAIELARHLNNSGITLDGIISSPKKRALTTARTIGEQYQLDVNCDSGLEEIDLGHWQGLTWQQVKEYYPEEFSAWYTNRRYETVKQGESYQVLVERILASLMKIIDGPYRNVLIVTHSAVMMCLMCLINDTPFEQMKSHKSGNCDYVLVDSMVIEKLHQQEGGSS